MAIKDIDEHKRLKIEDAWEGRSGELVEDFISRNIDTLNNKVVDSISYDPTSQILALINKKGEIITSGEVSPAKPAYSHNFRISKILVNGNEVSGDILCLIKDNIQLKVLYSLIAENPLTGHKNHITGKQKLSIKLGNGSFIDIEEGITSSDLELIIDISKYFTDTVVGTITLKVTTYVSGILEENRTLQATTESISVLNPKLGYVGNSYIVNGVASFQILNGGGASYQLRYKLNGGILNRSTSFNIDLLLPGLNKLEVYAVLADKEDVKTLTINVLVINIATQDTFDSLLVAVNEVSEVVSNWEYSKMYRLSLYTKGFTEEFININTKLTNTADDKDLYFNKNKQLETYMINSKDINPYYYEEDICYFFGIQALSQNTTSNLIVNINDKDILSFEDYVQIEINADSSFTYTEGANFYYDQFDPDNSNITTKEVLSKIESPDGIVLEDSLTIFRISAKEYTTPVVKQSLSNTLTNAGFTFELDFKSYNISDPNKPILKLGKFILYPTELNWQFSDSDDPNTDKTSRSSLFQEDERTHLVILVAPNFKAPSREIPTLVQALASKSINLVRIFINGVVDREFKYNSLSDFNLNGFNLEIAPEASDIDIYDLRVYNRALTLEEISNNYISTMSDINQKKFFQKTNAITATDIDNNTYISYTLAKLLYNTIVYVMPKGTQYLHQFSATKDTKIKDCTVFVNYVNHEKLPNQLTNEQIARSSGRFTGVELKGLGTSAMKYYWYNTSMKGKFTSHGCYDQADQTYKLPTDGNLLYNSKYYYMPTDPNIGIKKLVGKTNYASSMLSHKIGATKAFHDLWTACVDKSSFTELDMMGRKAVLEEPFLAFYIESDIESTDENSPMGQITPQYLETIDDQLIKFAGFQTWGSGKGDDATSGYDEDITPGYLMLEGAENDGKLANFLTPWMPDCIELSGETYKTLGLIVDKLGNTSYGTFDSLDVDFGLAEDSETELCEAAKKTMKKFIEAYNFVYMHTINLLPYTGTTSLNSDENKTLLDVTKKYYITNSRYSDSTGFAGSQWDVFRYDLYSSMWVPAGLPVLDENGKQVKHSTIKSPYGSDVYTYNIFNLKTFFKENGGTGAESFNNFRQLLIDKFKEGFGQYFHVDDIVFHQAFIKLFAGTDNRAKNTYFKLIDENSKISLLLDDMDTILATDNRGLLKKPYFLLEPSQESNPEYQGMWGGNSAFFEVFDIAYKEEINLMLKSILTLFEVNQEPSIHNWMQKYFYYVLEYYPATAYNHTARLCYECAQIFFDSQGSVDITWQNNGLDPVSQVHGSCLLSEKEFMKKRLIMFLSLAQVSNIFGKEGMGINIKASEDAGSEGVGSYTVDITPYQYLYLGYNSGSNPNLYSTERQTAEIPFTTTITIDSTTPLYSVLGARYIKKFDDFSNIFWKSGTYNLSAKRLIEMSARAKGGAVNKFLPPMINLETPVLTKLDLTGVSSLTTINLDSDHTPKLQEVYLTGTNITNVNLPTGSRLKTIYFPASLKELRIINNPGLTTVEFEGYDNIEIVYIDCAKCGQFDVSQFCENIKNSPLKSVTIRNANFNITEEALNHIIAPGVDYNILGTITIVESLESTTPKDISFLTKYNLVNAFGNIDEGLHGLTVIYTSSAISDYFEYPRQVNAYYEGEEKIEKGLFNISIPKGNDVKIVAGENPFNPSVNSYLDITYMLQNSIKGVSLDKLSGDLRITEKPSTSAKVIITVNTTLGKLVNNTTNYPPIEVLFEWVAPNIGDFAYADGSFSRSINPQKTMIGLVYDKVGDNNSGTVYIIGKEYSNNNAYYTRYTNNGANSDSSGLPKLISALNSYVSRNFAFESVAPSLTDRTKDIDKTLEGNITYDSKSTIENLTKYGKSDTKAYVDYVNNEMLKNIKNKLTTVGISGLGEFYIKTKQDLNDLCTALEGSDTIKDSGNTGSSLVFPYFYSMYLYEPELLHVDELLHDLYKKGNWYAPSYGELARVIYYRGYSAKGTLFSAASDVNVGINTTLLDLGEGYLEIPIFSLAKKELGYQFPSCWDNIVNNNADDYDKLGQLQSSPNIITNAFATTNPDNYAYQQDKYRQYLNSLYGPLLYAYDWIKGGNATDNAFEVNEVNIKAWAYTKHLGIPFTEFIYENPLNK